MNKLILIISLAALLAAGGAIFMLMKGNKTAHGEAPPPKPVHYTLAMEERTVNLADAPTPHYLRLVLELEILGHGSGGGHKAGGKKSGGHGGGGGEDSGPFAKYKSRLMDRLIVTVSRQHYKNLLSTEGKEHLKKALIEQFNEVLEKDGYKVEEVLFTDFVME